MIKAYINYPCPHMTLHTDSACPEIGKRGKPNQRDIPVTRTTFAAAINQLNGKGFRLGADASVDDVWLSVDFDDAAALSGTRARTRNIVGGDGALSSTRRQVKNSVTVDVGSLDRFRLVDTAGVCALAGACARTWHVELGNCTVGSTHVSG